MDGHANRFLDQTFRHEDSAPRDVRLDTGQVETLIVSLWSEILGLDVVGLDDNFLSIGGNSIQATQIVSRLRREFGLKISLRAILDGTTPAELAKSIVSRLDLKP